MKIAKGVSFMWAGHPDTKNITKPLSQIQRRCPTSGRRHSTPTLPNQLARIPARSKHEYRSHKTSLHFTNGV
eukprot:CAMPEP_0168532388 /NCGR_PEP_ID=MMETSP0405-20121227/16198_1 /TAXON_ID=498012 /ORGANISM="Trichosphaerium sp, Strain Am-I-7 wt" /LENGTH=71 /DNA_ID=CAMNT_0008557741 /DNA_START=478 /DNA_END=693 /DNA_ORIENTATION=-